MISQRLLRPVLQALLLCVPYGCSLTQPVAAPPTVQAAQALEKRGDESGAARIWERLAEGTSGEERNRMALEAARAHLAAHAAPDAARALGLLTEPLPAEQRADRALLEVELSLLRGEGAQAWQQLGAVAQPAGGPGLGRWLALRERAAFASGRLADAVSAHVLRERGITDPAELRRSRTLLLAELRDAHERGLRTDGRSPDRTVRGWLELAPLAAQAARDRAAAAPAIEAWRARNPGHPADEVVARELLGAPESIASPRTGGGQIALLLPLSGRQAAAGVSVRDGFMAAWYQLDAAERPGVRVYDTAAAGAGAALGRALQEGAEFVVGPLTREDVAAVAGSPGRHVPVLALNHLAPGLPVPADFVQFALSPEEEARQVAQRLIADGNRRGIALVPSGEWGTRVLGAFRQELEAAGGGLQTSATFDPELTDFSEPIMQVLRLTESRARHKRLEAVLGTKLQFEPRRRADVEFIFAPAPANIERLLRPQLRFHYAGGIPTYATSEAFEPDPRANQDLDGLIFPDMPWMVGSDLATAVRAAAHDAWPVGGPRRGRLFAFGFDALRLAGALRAHGNTVVTLDGLTGKLTVEAQRVQRELVWAQLRNGELRLLAAPAT